MRLALLSPLPPEQSGIADYAAHCRQALNQAGVDVLTPLQGQRPIPSLAAARAWVAERDWRRVDVVHAELGEGRLAEFYTLCALAALPNRPALSATLHDPERLIWRPASGPGRWAAEQAWLPRPAVRLLAAAFEPWSLMAERRLARQLDGVVAFTQIGATQAARRLGLRADRISVISHGVPALPPRPLPLFDPVRLLYFGYVQPGKGIEDLIDALGRLRAKHPELASTARLTIAGGTSPSLARKPSYVDELRARIERRGVVTQIDWELNVDSRDIPDLIQRHHLVVLPTRERGGLGLFGRKRGTSGALAWAIACGRGVLASDARAFAEEVSHGNGAAFAQGDVAALTRQLHDVLVEPQVLQRWAEKASALALSRVWPTTGQRFAGHFQRAAERAPRKPAV